MKPIIIVHGGAGEITDARVPGKIKGIKTAVQLGYNALKKGGSVLDAVEEAVRSMELDENFNAGYGSVLNIDGDVEVEASIMSGNLKAGCVSVLHDIMHPVSVARRVMEKSNHTFIAGESAMKFAIRENFQVLPEGSLVTENAKAALNEFKEREHNLLDTEFALTELDQLEALGDPGTVGAVAIDKDGNIAAATSTGGITGKVPGRIGDTPVLGCGTYADDNIGGISTTGHGETIMKFNLAQKILQRMSNMKMNAQEATADALKEMTDRLTGTGGAITISKDRDIGIFFTSRRMAWAYIKDEELHYGVNQNEDTVEPLEI